MSKIKHAIILLQFSTYLMATRGTHLGGHCADAMNAYIHLILQTYPGIVLPPFSFQHVGNDRLWNNYHHNLPPPLHGYTEPSGMKIQQAAIPGMVTSQYGQGGHVGGVMNTYHEISHQSGGNHFVPMNSFDHEGGIAEKTHVEHIIEKHDSGNHGGTADTYQYKQKPYDQQVVVQQNIHRGYSGASGGPKPVGFGGGSGTIRPYQIPSGDAHKKTTIGFAAENTVFNQAGGMSSYVGAQPDEIYYSGIGTKPAEYQGVTNHHQQNAVHQQGGIPKQTLGSYLQGEEMRKETAGGTGVPKPGEFGVGRPMESSGAIRPYQLPSGDAHKENTIGFAAGNAVSNQAGEMSSYVGAQPDGIYYSGTGTKPAEYQGVTNHHQENAIHQQGGIPKQTLGFYQQAVEVRKETAGGTGGPKPEGFGVDGPMESSGAIRPYQIPSGDAPEKTTIGFAAGNAGGMGSYVGTQPDGIYYSGVGTKPDEYQGAIKHNQQNTVHQQGGTQEQTLGFYLQGGEVRKETAGGTGGPKPGGFGVRGPMESSGAIRPYQIPSGVAHKENTIGFAGGNVFNQAGGISSYVGTQPDGTFYSGTGTKQAEYQGAIKHNQQNAVHQQGGAPKQTLGLYVQGGEVRKETVGGKKIEGFGYGNKEQEGEVHHSFYGQNGGGQMYSQHGATFGGMEIIEPGGEREIVTGGHQVMISNTNCPDGSDLCIIIDT